MQRDWRDVTRDQSWARCFLTLNILFKSEIEAHTDYKV